MLRNELEMLGEEVYKERMTAIVIGALPTEKDSAVTQQALRILRAIYQMTFVRVA